MFRIIKITKIILEPDGITTYKRRLVMRARDKRILLKIFVFVIPLACALAGYTASLCG